MPVRYIGRQPTQKGKALYQICQQLANSGVGRVVYRTKDADTWPTQKSFYRLTQVIPDKACPDCRKGTAWGQRVFRGRNYGEEQITTGNKSDWILVPKRMEQEFCEITEMAELEPEPPSHIEIPPWLKLLLKKEKPSEKVQIPMITEPIKLPLDS